jgi:hypothetical protein
MEIASESPDPVLAQDAVGVVALLLTQAGMRRQR